MNQNDEKLSALLKQWRDIEPRANFEANVWRRIRLAQAEQPEHVSPIEFLQRLLWRPALATAAAVTISVIVGSSAGVLSISQRPKVASGELDFLSRGSLAGSYLMAGTEKSR